MARVKGKDVILEMMDSIERLEEIAKEHEHRLKELGDVAMDSAARIVGLASGFGTLTSGLRQLTTQVGQVTTQMGQVTTQMGHLGDQAASLTSRIEALESDMLTLAQGFRDGAAAQRESQQHLARLGRLLVQYAGNSDSRFDAIEGRLDALESA